MTQLLSGQPLLIPDGLVGGIPTSGDLYVAWIDSAGRSARGERPDLR